MDQNEFDNFDKFCVTLVFDEFGGFRDFKMEEQAFHCIPKKILHVNKVLDNLESLTKFISLTAFSHL